MPTTPPNRRPHRRLRRCRPAPLAALVLLAATAGPTRAEEMEVSNDSFVSGGPAVIVGDFVPFEQAAVRLTSPCDGAIVAVQIGWLSGIPQDPSLEEAIYIYAGGSFPAPGATLEVLAGPVLTPGFLNEFRYLDEGQMIPLNVPIKEGEQFYVALEFANPTDVGNGGASVFRDVDGCQTGRNSLFAIPGGWLNFCLFLQGDLVIRAVVDCTEGPGACCFDNGTCLFLEQDVCLGANGTFQGSGVLCADVECDVAAQACCFEAGGCLDLPPADCQGAGGSAQGADTDCATTECLPTGACCLVDGTCVDDQSPDDCEGADGVYQGDATSCGIATCPEPTGGCCFPNNFCLELTEEDCLMVGASWGGFDTNCDDANENGTADLCEDACLEDISGNGVVDFADILAILAAWGSCEGCPEDISGNGEVDFADVLAVLGAWGECAG